MNSARGAARLVADSLAAAHRAGAGREGGAVLVRADSAFFTREVVAAATRHNAAVSITVRANPAVERAISTIPQSAWLPIHYPNAVWDDEEQRWISDAEVAEVGFTAFTGRRKAEHVTARLVVRRVRRRNPASVNGEQGELFAAYRYHAFFTTSDLDTITADITHRGHAVIEQVIADLKNRPLAHLPSGKYAATAAWLVLAAISFNLLRAAGCLAAGVHARATTGTLRNRMINVPARLARSARRLTLHLPDRWPWAQPLARLFAILTSPPLAAAA